MRLDRGDSIVYLNPVAGILKISLPTVEKLDGAGITSLADTVLACSGIAAKARAAKPQTNGFIMIFVISETKITNFLLQNTQKYLDI